MPYLAGLYTTGPEKWKCPRCPQRLGAIDDADVLVRSNFWLTYRGGVRSSKGVCADGVSIAKDARVLAVSYFRSGETRRNWVLVYQCIQHHAARAIHLIKWLTHSTLTIDSAKPQAFKNVQM